LKDTGTLGELVKLPDGKKMIGCRWVFARKSAEGAKKDDKGNWCYTSQDWWLKASLKEKVLIIWRYLRLW
jgi:hypothetical protein